MDSYNYGRSSDVQAIVAVSQSEARTDSIDQSDQGIIFGLRVSTRLMPSPHNSFIEATFRDNNFTKSLPDKETPQRDRRPSMLKSGKKVINLTKIEAERGATSSIRHFKQNTSAGCRKK